MIEITWDLYSLLIFESFCIDMNLYPNLIEQAIDFCSSNCATFLLRVYEVIFIVPFYLFYVPRWFMACFHHNWEISANGGEGLNPGLNVNNFYFEDF